MTQINGWSEPDGRGYVTFTEEGASRFAQPPSRDGFQVYFVARVGRPGGRPGGYTRWTYRPAVFTVRATKRTLDTIESALTDGCCGPTSTMAERQRAETMADVLTIVRGWRRKEVED